MASGPPLLWLLVGRPVVDARDVGLVEEAEDVARVIDDQKLADVVGEGERADG